MASAASNQKTIPFSLKPVLEYVLKNFEKYRKTSCELPLNKKNISSNTPIFRKPLVVGITGPQGLGKSTLAESLQDELESGLHPCGRLNVQRFSLDDVYLSHSAQTALAQQQTENPLIQTRGQPGTHDIGLCLRMLDALCGPCGKYVKVPEYDKSAFGGEGDRAFDGYIPSEKEISVARQTPEPLDIIIFEGWCVGFQSKIKENQDRMAKMERTANDYNTVTKSRDFKQLVDYLPKIPTNTLKTPPSLFETLRLHPEYLDFVDLKLAQYQKIWDYFDVFVHLDAQDIDWVYSWRLEQEHALIKARGRGKSDSEVKQFIDGYMSSYYVYVPHLRKYMPSSSRAETNNRFAAADTGNKDNNKRTEIKRTTYSKLQNKLGTKMQGHIRLVVNKDRSIYEIISNSLDELPTSKL